MKLKIKKIIIILVSVLFIILVFALIDYFFHLLSEEYSVPSYYFTNKIIYGTLWGLGAYYFIRKLSPIKKSVIFSLIVSVFLQVKYFLEGYPLDFVILFLGIHFVILLITSWIVFSFVRKYQA